MIPWTRVRKAHYERLIVQLAAEHELDDDDMLLDLVYLADEAHYAGAELPGVRALAARWGTSKRKAVELQADPRWREWCARLEVTTPAPRPAVGGRKTAPLEVEVEEVDDDAGRSDTEGRQGSDDSGTVEREEAEWDATGTVPGRDRDGRGTVAGRSDTEERQGSDDSGTVAGRSRDAPGTVAGRTRDGTPPNHVVEPPLSAARAYEPTSLREQQEASGLEDVPTEIDDPDRQLEAPEPELAFPLRLVAAREGGNSPPPPALTEGTKIALRAAGLQGGRAVAELTRKELLDVPGVGKKRLDEIETWLGSHGLSLKEAPLDEARLIQRCAETWTTAWSRASWKTSKYPWELAGADRERIRKWIAALDLPGDDLTAGLARLERAVDAYLDAVERRTAWPEGDPPTTGIFTVGLASWILEGDKRKPAATAAVKQENPFEATRGGLARELRFRPLNK